MITITVSKADADLLRLGGKSTLFADIDLGQAAWGYGLAAAAPYVLASVGYAALSRHWSTGQPPSPIHDRSGPFAECRALLAAQIERIDQVAREHARPSAETGEGVTG